MCNEKPQKNRLLSSLFLASYFALHFATPKTNLMLEFTHQNIHECYAYIHAITFSLHCQPSLLPSLGRVLHVRITRPSPTSEQGQCLKLIFTPCKRCRNIDPLGKRIYLIHPSNYAPFGNSHATIVPHFIEYSKVCLSRRLRHGRGLRRQIASPPTLSTISTLRRYVRNLHSRQLQLCN